MHFIALCLSQSVGIKLLKTGWEWTGLICWHSPFKIWSIYSARNGLFLTYWGRHFADESIKRIFLSENVWISIEFPLRFVRKGPINNIPTLAQIMAWHRTGDNQSSEPMEYNLLTHICVTRPQCNAAFYLTVLCWGWLNFVVFKVVTMYAVVFIAIFFLGI